MASLRIAAFAAALLGSSMLVGEASAAMPVNGLSPATKQIASVEKVWCRWRCGGGWRGGYWGHRRWSYGYGYGWRRRWY